MINQKRLGQIPTDGPFFLFRSCIVNEFYPAIESAFYKILDKLNMEYFESDGITGTELEDSLRIRNYPPFPNSGKVDNKDLDYILN